MFEAESNFSLIINPYLATYDAHSVVHVYGTPVLPVFTICHWLKLDSVPEGRSTKTFFQVWMAGMTNVNQVWSDIVVQANKQIVLLMYIRPLVYEKPEIQR